MLDTEATDVAALTSRVVEQLDPLATKMHSTMEVVSDGNPVIADLDPRRLERILRNLLTNALEHGEGKPVTVTIASDADAVAIGVRDRGVGLRPGEESLVFNRFWRADPARTRRIGGSGLGLAISFEDARLHGGWLDAWGAPGQGAHFRVTVPKRAGEQVSHSPLELEPTDASARYPNPYARKVRT